MEVANTNLSDAKIGLVVPKYITINSISDLNNVSGKFKNKIIGIEARAGVTQKTYQALRTYQLQLDVETGDSQSMIDTLTNAITKKDWVVVTGWTPHWKFAQWDLKFLQDEKQVFGASEEIKSIVRRDLAIDNPILYSIMKNFKWNASLSASLAMQIREGVSPEVAATEFLSKNPQLLNGL